MPSTPRSSRQTNQDANKSKETFWDRHPILKSMDKALSVVIEAAVAGVVVYVMHRFPDRLFPK